MMQPDRLLALLFGRVFSRGLAYMMFTKFWDYFTPSLLSSVSNIYVQFSRKFGVIVYPLLLPSEQTSYMDALS